MRCSRFTSAVLTISAGAVIAILCTTAANARSINDGLGRTSFTWLKTLADAEISATGGCMAARDDVTGMFVQPAAITGVVTPVVKMSYASHYVDTQYGSMGYARIFRGRPVGIRLTYINYGTFQGRTSGNEPTGTFTAGDLGLTVNLGRTLRDDLSVGIMATYIVSKLADYSAQVATVDIGAIYHPNFQGLTVGAALMNMGTVVNSYTTGYDETLPVYLQVGARKILEHAPITLYTDVIFPNDNDISYAYGIEIALHDAFRLYAGTRSRSDIDRELHYASTDFSAMPTFGVSMTMKDYRFAYSYCPDEDLEDIHRVTLGLSLH